MRLRWRWAAMAAAALGMGTGARQAADLRPDAVYRLPAVRRAGHYPRALSGTGGLAMGACDLALGYIGVAAALGVVIGWCTARRRRPWSREERRIRLGRPLEAAIDGDRDPEALRRALDGL
jgi:hypothetical protein